MTAAPSQADIIIGHGKSNLDNHAPSLAAEMEALREVYAALNRNDIAAIVNIFDPQIEWNEPAEYPLGGKYHGHAAVAAHLSQARGTWAEGSCEPERFIVAGNKIVVFVHVRARLSHETEWREGRLADVYKFRSGKATQMHSFADRRQALEWAGCNDSDAT
jgi:ketosteroid isomerase-like protein